MELVNRSGLAAAFFRAKIQPPQESLIAVVKGTFLLSPAVALAPEQLPPAGFEYDEANDLRYDSDFAPFKPYADVLFVGGKPTKDRPVKLGVGSWSKSITNEPAGFGPIPMTSPGRKSKMGSYGGDWLKTRWPWFPEDFDWSFFNSAPADQQLREYLAGDEEILLENFHPTRPPLRSRLSPLRPRCFVGDEFREIAMRLDTLWVDGEAEKLVLVWRGNVEAKNFSHLYVTSEPLRSPARSLEEHRRDLRDALRVPLEETEEAPVPKPSPVFPSVKPDEAVRRAEEQIANAQTEAAKIESQAIDALKAKGIPLPSPVSYAQVERQVSDSLIRARETLASMGVEIPPALAEAIAASPKLPGIPAPPEEPIPAAPAPTRRSLRARIEGKESLEGEDLSDANLAGFDLSGMNLRGAVLRDVSLRKANLEGADLTDAVLCESDLTEARARGAVFRDANLAEALLVRADLTDANLSGADLSQANLEGARLAGILADGSIWNFADLISVDLTSARLSGADLGRSRLYRADLSKAVLREASLQKCMGRGVRFDEADLTKLKASEANLGESRFHKVRGEDSVWDKATLFQADFSFSRMSNAEFASAYLAGANFSYADLKHARFTEAILQGARMRRANLFRGSLHKADLTGADFREANLYEAETWDALFQETVLEGANLRRTKWALGLIRKEGR